MTKKAYDKIAGGLTDALEHVNNMPAQADPDRIWLQPWCPACEAGGSERLWCKDNVWIAGDACECGKPATEYVRADLAKDDC